MKGTMRSLQFGLITIVCVVAIACGGSSSTPTNPTPTPTPTPTPAPATGTMAVSIVTGASTLTTTAYNPSPLSVASGTTVRWTNNDSTTHTSTSNTAAWSSGNLAPGDHFDFTFQTTGTFTYHCAIHPGMVGTVVVQ